MKIDELQSLTENVTTEQLNLYFVKVLEYANSIDSINTCEIINVLEILCELSDKQWHTYRLVHETIKFNIEMFIKKTLNLKSLDYINYVTEIIAYLGLEDSFKILKDALNLPLDETVRREINEFVLELEDSIENPYNGM